MEKKNVNNNWVSFIIVAGIITAMLCWYTGVRDNGVGANEVRGNIDTARNEQQSAIDRLGNVEAGLDYSIESAGTISDGLADTAKSVDSTKDRIEASEGRLTESSRLIDEGKSILTGVRKRNEEKD